MEHLIIVHAFTSDEEGDHYLDDPVPPGTPVRWTAYERIDQPGGEILSPWEADAETFEDIRAAALNRAAEIGLDPIWSIRVEHYPEDVYAD